MERFFSLSSFYPKLKAQWTVMETPTLMRGCTRKTTFLFFEGYIIE
jgi:hypothetical protein